MKFDDFELSDAHGCVLAHTVRIDQVVIKKGICIGDEELDAMRVAGLETVTAVRLDADDVPEDMVAAVLAQGLCGDGVDISTPVAGRCNVHAVQAGLVEIEPEPVNCINRAGHGVLVATLNSFEVVEPGRIIATIKVGPYALSKRSMDELVNCVRDTRALAVHPFKPHSVGLVLSRVPGQKESLLDKAHEVIAARLESYGSHISEQTRCAHRAHDIAQAVSALVDQVDVVMVLGAASPCDIKDVVPAAFAQAGGTVDMFGIPVDPGNLMVSGHLKGKPILGLPGCARSSALNGVDLVFARLLAGCDVGAHELLGLGVGGLLAEVSERPQAREVHSAKPSAWGVKLSAVVLAGGLSRRMGDDNKLLASWQGKPLVRHVVETALASHVDEVVVVTGHDAASVRQALSGLAVRYVHNPHFNAGLSTSLRVGIGAVDDQLGGAVILLGDMPRLALSTLNEMIARYVDGQAQHICVPSCQGRRGNPVIWPREFFRDILDVSGDRGAKALLAQYSDRVLELVCEDPGVLNDVDTPADLEILTAK